MVVIPFSVAHARENALAAVKHLYGSLFDWLLRKLNGEHGRHIGGDWASKPCVGILDIFGFEVFQKNSFEQLCINYANEQLQRQFNASVFETEKKVYVDEGIDASYVSYRDNADVLACVGLLRRTRGVVRRDGARRRRDGPRGRVAATPRRASWTVRGAGSRRRRGERAGRSARTPRPRPPRGYSVEKPRSGRSAARGRASCRF